MLSCCLFSESVMQMREYSKQLLWGTHAASSVSRRWPCFQTCVCTNRISTVLRRERTNPETRRPFPRGYKEWLRPPPPPPTPGLETKPGNVHRHLLSKQSIVQCWRNPQNGRIYGKEEDKCKQAAFHLLTASGTARNTDPAPSIKLHKSRQVSSAIWVASSPS